MIHVTCHDLKSIVGPNCFLFFFLLFATVGLLQRQSRVTKGDSSCKGEARTCKASTGCFEINKCSMRFPAIWLAIEIRSLYKETFLWHRALLCSVKMQFRKRKDHKQRGLVKMVKKRCPLSFPWLQQIFKESTAGYDIPASCTLDKDTKISFIQSCNSLQFDYLQF